MWGGYLRHARELDRVHSAPGQTPIEDRLRWFSETRGLVFGGYAEASADVHDLLTLAARIIAEREYRLAGARSASEMRSFVTSQLRRRMGLAAVQAMARHRLSRVPFVGVPRGAIEARRLHADGLGHRTRYDASAFFGHQAYAHAA